MWKALIKLVEKWACGHEWSFYFDRRCEDRIEGRLADAYNLHTFICKKCGKFKQKKI